jgi:hypothetical protein
MESFIDILFIRYLWFFTYGVKYVLLRVGVSGNFTKKYFVHMNEP